MDKEMDQEREVELEVEIDIVTLETDDGDMDCGVITMLEIDDKEYIALSPLDENEELTEEVWFYHFKRDPSGADQHEIIFIEDEDEYDKVAEAFGEWLDTLEFEEVEESEE